jgi:hypothetical protein
MTDIPIIFSAPMVRALLENRKTMTRRLAWRDPVKHGPLHSPWRRVKPGDRLWVRESLYREPSPVGWRYSADKEVIALFPNDPRVSAMIAWAHHKEGNNASPIHMPRWVSRLTLIVTAAKIERLQNISETDAQSEGIVAFKNGNAVNFGIEVEGDYSPYGLTGRECFMNFWCDLHGPRAWVDNPEVVALSFDVYKQNIDAMPREIAA